MKKWFWGVVCGLALSSLTAMAQEQVNGTVFEDLNGNGTRDGSEPGIANILVTDGVQFVRTNAEGKYSFERVKGRKFSIVHQPTGWAVPHWFHWVAKDSACDFAMRRVAVADTVRVLQVTDIEANDFPFLPEIRTAAKNFGVDFIVNTGDLCRWDGILAHKKNFTSEMLEKTVYYAVGNHDLEAPDKEGKRYEDHLGPMWYSFEKNGILFVAAPMYLNADFHKFAAELFKMFPDSPKVVFCHEDHLMNANYRKEIPGSGGMKWNEQHIKAWLYGHWHNNVVDKRDGMVSYCVNAPNKGGIDFSPACFRLLDINTKGDVRSELIWAGIDSHVAEINPDHLPPSWVAYSSVAQCLDKGPGRIAVWTWDSKYKLGPSSIQKIPFSDGRSVSPKPIFLKGMTPAPLLPLNAQWPNFLGNATHNGNVLPQNIDKLSLAWIANAPTENFMSSPIVYEGKVFMGSMDDANAEEGGVSAFDAANGKKLWFFKTGYSVKNSIAAADGKIFLCDARGNTYAVDAVTGKEVWIVPGDESTFPCISTGVVVDSGVVYSGARAMLKAIDAATGSVLWKGKAHNHGEVSINTLTVADGRLFTLANWRGFHAYDTQTGKSLWTLNDGDQRFQSGTPVIDSGELYLKGKEYLYKVDPTNGKVLLKKKLGELHSAAAPVVMREMVLVGGQDALYAVNRNNFEVIWTFSQKKPALISTTPYRFQNTPIESTPVVTGNTVWVGGSDGVLYGLDLADGKIKERYDLGMSIFASPAVVGDNLFIADFAGRLFRFVRSQ